MKIRCLYDALVNPQELKPHPKNRNSHPEKQISRLSQLIAFQGIRAPIVVSKRSGFIVKGHGTLLALKKLAVESVPVVFQDFESEEQEYAFLQSDNAIATWSELDLSGINADLQDLGPDFDLDLLGLENFKLDLAEIEEIKPEVEFSKELDEKNDYLVFLFASKEDFKSACDKYGVKQVETNPSATLHPGFQITGLGRILPGGKLFE